MTKKRPSQGEIQIIRRRLIEEGAFGGGFDIPEDDLAPADVVMEEMRRSLALVRFVEKHMSNWNPTLVPLSERNYDDKGAMQVSPTEEAAWMALWNQERQHLVRVAKMAADMGIDERRIEIQEQQAELLFGIIEQAFEALQLTQDQREKLPVIMPQIVRSLALPGEVVSRSDEVLG